MTRGDGDKKLYSAGAERAVLSCIIKQPQLFFSIRQIVDVGDFYVKGHQMTYDIVKHLIQKGTKEIDKDIIEASLDFCNIDIDDYNTYTKNGEYIEKLFVTNIARSNLQDFALKVKDFSIKRHLIGLSNEIQKYVKNTNDSAIQVLSKVQNDVSGIVNNLVYQNGIKKLGAGFLQWVDSAADDRKNIGLPIFLKSWGNSIGEMRRGSVTVLAARPKQGKSTLALALGSKLAIEHDIPVLYVDTQLKNEYQKMKFGAMISGVSYNRIQTGLWRTDPEQKQSVKRGGEKIEDVPLYHIEAPGLSPQQIFALIKRFLINIVGRQDDGQIKNCLVIYDYLKLTSQQHIGKGMAQHQQLGYYFSKLHDIANQYNIPMFVLCQRNRSDGQDDTSLAMTDRISWFASSLSILRAKTSEQLEHTGQNGDYRLKTVLTRYGQGMADNEYLNIFFDRRRGYFRQGRRQFEISQTLSDSIRKRKK